MVLLADNVYWKCPVCGFEAKNEEEKRKHMKDTKDDPEHRKAHEEIEKEEEKEQGF